MTPPPKPSTIFDEFWRQAIELQRELMASRDSLEEAI